MKGVPGVYEKVLFPTSWLFMSGNHFELLRILKFYNKSISGMD